MGRADAAVILMLLYARYSFVKTQVFPGEPFNCNIYIDNVMKDLHCKPEGLFSISDDVMDDGVFTRKELIEEISARCDNITLIDRYINCLNELAVECPVQYQSVLNLTNQKIQMFCDGTDISSWLLTTLANGYTFNQACVSVTRDLVGACVQELSTYNDFEVNMTLTAMLEILPQAVSFMFQCTKSRFANIPASYQDCGSDWTDMLLTTWLKVSSSMGIGVYLGPDEILQLQAMKTGQRG